MSTVPRAATLYFLVLFAAGFAFGTVRVLWLAPQVGTRAAELMEMPLMLGVMVLASRRIVRAFRVPPRPAQRLAMGALALLLMLIAEFAVLLPLQGRTFTQHWADLDPAVGSAYYGLLAVFALLPLAAGRSVSWRAAAAAAGGLACAATFLAYRIDASHARDAIAAGGSRMASTQCGPVEYADVGTGPVLLLVHGAGGGFDQLRELAEPLARDGNRVIAMSRFGYLRTPLPDDASPQAQADAHACLLDALGIERATIAGISAGAPSALHFALRHAHRCDGLALLVPLAYWPGFDPKPPSAVARFMYEHGVRSGFVYWLAVRFAPAVVQKTVLATPPRIIAHASADEQARVKRLTEHIMPLDLREQGLVNDARVAAALEPLPLERIEALILIISLQDDLYGTFESARHTALGIPGARFVAYEQGGHVWVGHHAEVVEELRLFMRTTPWDLVGPVSFATSPARRTA